MLSTVSSVKTSSVTHLKFLQLFLRVFFKFWPKFILNSTLPGQGCSSCFIKTFMVFSSFVTSYFSRCLRKESNHSFLYTQIKPSVSPGRACILTELMGSIICLYRFCNFDHFDYFSQFDHFGHFHQFQIHFYPFPSISIQFQLFPTIFNHIRTFFSYFWLFLAIFGHFGYFCRFGHMGSFDHSSHFYPFQTISIHSYPISTNFNHFLFFFAKIHQKFSFLARSGFFFSTD